MACPACLRPAAYAAPRCSPPRSNASPRSPATRCSPCFRCARRSGSAARSGSAIPAGSCVALRVPLELPARSAATTVPTPSRSRSWTPRPPFCTPRVLWSACSRCSPRHRRRCRRALPHRLCAPCHVRARPRPRRRRGHRAQRAAPGARRHRTPRGSARRGALGRRYRLRAGASLPRQLEYLHRRVVSCGAVVSEFPPGFFPPRRWCLLASQRLLAALADVVVIVEAGTVPDASLRTRRRRPGAGRRRCARARHRPRRAWDLLAAARRRAPRRVRSGRARLGPAGLSGRAATRG